MSQCEHGQCHLFRFAAFQYDSSCFLFFLLRFFTLLFFLFNSYHVLVLVRSETCNCTIFISVVSMFFYSVRYHVLFVVCSFGIKRTYCVKHSYYYFSLLLWFFSCAVMTFEFLKLRVEQCPETTETTTGLGCPSALVLASALALASALVFLCKVTCNANATHLNGESFLLHESCEFFNVEILLKHVLETWSGLVVAVICRLLHSRVTLVLRWQHGTDFVDLTPSGNSEMSNVGALWSRVICRAIAPLSWSLQPKHRKAFFAFSTSSVWKASFSLSKQTAEKPCDFFSALIWMRLE